jgi:hypothetical protein
MKLAILNPGRPPKKGKKMATKKKKSKKKKSVTKFLVANPQKKTKYKRRKNPGKLLNVRNWKDRLTPIAIGGIGAFIANFAYSSASKSFTFDPKWNPYIKIGLAGAAAMFFPRNKMVLYGSIAYGGMAVYELGQQFFPQLTMGSQADFYAMQNYARSLGANQVRYPSVTPALLGANQVIFDGGPSNSSMYEVEDSYNMSMYG